MICFELNKELDKEIYLDFVDLKFSGADFGKKIHSDHPMITKENYLEFIDEYYKTNEREIKLSRQELIKELGLKQEQFYFQIKNIFGFDFSNVECVGYLSIFDCNPRWPENNTFQVFYKRSLENKIGVVFHELAHFVFFKYFDENFGNISSKYSKNDGPLWELSEIFNVILLNMPEFQKIIGREEGMFYPNLKEKLLVAKEEWAKNPDLKSLIQNSLQINGK